MASPTFDPTATGPAGLAIANHVGRLLSEYTGREPTKARTSFGDDLVTVVVRDLFTKGERSLVRDGRADPVLDLRRAYQATMGDELTDGIEEITGRRANHIDPDIAIESFVLAPRQRALSRECSRFAWTMRKPAARGLDPDPRPVRSSTPRPATPSSRRRKQQRFEPAVPSRTDRSSAPRRRSAVAALLPVA
jgi:uncharacterized protein YbcI